MTASRQAGRCAPRCPPPPPLRREEALSGGVLTKEQAVRAAVARGEAVRHSRLISDAGARRRNMIRSGIRQRRSMYTHEYTDNVELRLLLARVVVYANFTPVHVLLR